TAEAQQVLAGMLGGVRAADVMARHAPVVDARATLRDLAYGAALRGSHSTLLVHDDGHVVGTLMISRLQSIPRDRWSETTVGAVMSALAPDAVVGPETGMREVLERMRAAEDGQILVMEDEHLVGSISRHDVAQLAERARAVARA